MAKIIKVESCFKCPYIYYRSHQINNHHFLSPWCIRGEREVSNDKIIIIQDWCPLPDAPEDKEDK